MQYAFNMKRGKLKYQKDVNFFGQPYIVKCLV